MENCGQEGGEGFHLTYFKDFGTPSISRERFKLEISNLACRLATRGLSEIMQN